MLIPVPHFTEAQRIKLPEFVKEYQNFTSAVPLESVRGDAEGLLKQINTTSCPHTGCLRESNGNC